MTTSTPRQQQASITRESVSRDVELLVKMPTAILTNILRSSSSSTSRLNSAENAEQKAATDILNDFSPSATTPNDSQSLAKAYIRSMQDDVMQVKEQDEGEVVAKQLDDLRARGQGVAEALSEIKV